MLAAHLPESAEGTRLRGPCLTSECFLQLSEPSMRLHPRELHPHEWLALILVTQPNRGTSSEYSILPGVYLDALRPLATTCLMPAGDP